MPENAVGRYRLLRKISADQATETWEAIHASRRRAAIQFLLPPYAGNRQFEDRLLHAGRNMTKLDHPNLVSVNDCVQIDGRTYLVTQFVEGETLEARLERAPLEQNEINSIYMQVLSALEYLHSHAAAHGNLKLENIVLDRSGNVFLTSFGIPGLPPNLDPIDLQSDLESFRRLLDEMSSQEREAASASDEDVQFTVYRPHSLPPGAWKMLLAFAHKSTAEPGAPDPIAEVQRQAEQLLGQDIRDYRNVSQDSNQAIPRDGQLTLTPRMEGATFQPASQSLTWTGKAPPAVFLFSAREEFLGRTLRGELCIFLGNIIVGQVPLSVRVEQASLVPQQPYVQEGTRWFRHIFASYSHDDTAIVEEFERHAIAFGDDYLRDVTTLRAGVRWGDELQNMIRRADVFQLFWSHNAMNSEYVRQEYSYALSLRREGFIRPVYWQDPMPQADGLPPAELRQLHFHKIAPKRVRPITKVGAAPNFPGTETYSPPPPPPPSQIDDTEETTPLYPKPLPPPPVRAAAGPKNRLWMFLAFAAITICAISFIFGASTLAGHNGILHLIQTILR